MIRKVRSSIFWGLCLVFAVVGPLVILYAKGYRFDFVKKKFVATGALFLKSEPPGATIYVDGIERGETSGTLKDVLTKSSLIANILPGEHDVRVEMPDHTPWAKKLTVRAHQVTEARSLVLFPEHNIPKTLVFNEIADAKISPDNKYLAVVRNSSATSWVILVRLEDYRQTVLHTERHLQKSKEPATVVLHGFTPDSRFLVGEIRHAKAATELFSVDVTKADAKPFRFTLQSSPDIMAIRAPHHAVFTDKNGVLREWDASSPEAPRMLTAHAWGVFPSGEHLYTLEGLPSLLYLRKPNRADPEQLVNAPLGEASSTHALTVYGAHEGNIVTLVIPRMQHEGTAWLIDGNKNPVKLRENVRGLELSPEGKKLLMRTKDELWVYYLEDVAIQPIHRRGESILIGRFGTGVRQAYWHPQSGDYIFYVINDGLFATELDDRGGQRNTVQLVRNGDVGIVSVTRDAIYFTAQKRPARYLLKPEKE